MVNRYGTISRKGNVELCVYGKWRMMCANSWDNRDASVVCREIGYSPFGKSVSSVWLDRKLYNASTLLVYIMQSILITCTVKKGTVW